MASKSNLTVVIESLKGGSLEIQDDAAGYLSISANDGVNTVQILLGQADANVLSRVLSLSNALRASIPQS